MYIWNYLKNYFPAGKYTSKEIATTKPPPNNKKCLKKVWRYINNNIQHAIVHKYNKYHSLSNSFSSKISYLYNDYNVRVHNIRMFYFGNISPAEESKTLRISHWTSDCLYFGTRIFCCNWNTVPCPVHVGLFHHRTTMAYCHHILLEVCRDRHIDEELSCRHPEFLPEN